MKEKRDNFQAYIPEIEKIIGYTFRDKSLITQAFTRTSFCNENGGGYQSNEVLEFIGDSVLSVAIITFLTDMHAVRYEHGIKTVFGEGDFSNIKSKLSDKKNLSECITAIGLEKYLRLGEGDKKLGIEREPSVKEDLFESIIGATYLDCDRDIGTVMRVVSRMLDVSVYAVKTPPTQSSKNALQEFCADKKRKLPPPIYKTLGEEGPDHKKVYERGVYIGDRLVASATGKNLKIADAGAAEAALKILLQEEEEKAKPSATDAKPSSISATPKNAEPKKADKAKAKVASAEADKSKKATKKQKKAGKKQTIVDNTKAEKTSKAPDKAEQAAPSITVATQKNATRGGTSSTAKLKAHATRRKIMTPTFKDLGEVRQGGKAVCRVECIFMGKSIIGEGDSRQAAKEAAAAKMLQSVTTDKPTSTVKKASKTKPAATEAKQSPTAAKATKAKPTATEAKQSSNATAPKKAKPSSNVAKAPKASSAAAASKSAQGKRAAKNPRKTRPQKRK